MIRQYLYDAGGRMVLGKNIESGEESAYAYNTLKLCVGNTQKLAAAGDFRNREMQYVPDFLSSMGNELMTYETGAGAATSRINYLSGFMGQKSEWNRTGTGSRVQGNRKKSGLWDFLKETVTGGITDGVASAGFYGAGKGIERLKDSFRSGRRVIISTAKDEGSFERLNPESS